MVKKSVFITGIAGFIGFHLACALKKRGDEVTGLDNFNNYYDVNLKKGRSRVLEDLGVHTIHADITNSKSFQEIINTVQPTHIVHLAAQAGVRYSLINPHQYIASNISGFVNLLEILKTKTHVPLIYASSSSVYGNNETPAFSVKDHTDHPANLYGATKKANELMAYAYHHLFGIRSTGLRYFTVYGPWGRPDMAYFSFTKTILEGKPIPVFNHGKMQRDFTYIDDVIDGTIKALDLSAACEIFNLGNNKPESLDTFITTLENGLGKKAVRNLLEMQAGDMLQTCADIEHSQKKLGYKPTTSLQEGLQHFLNWYKEYYSL